MSKKDNSNKEDNDISSQEPLNGNQKDSEDKVDLEQGANENAGTPTYEELFDKNE